MRESDFQAAVVDLAERCGWRVMHISESIRRVRRGTRYVAIPDEACRGWPDLTLVHPTAGIVLFRELKAGRGKLTEHQRTWLRDLHNAGADADVWRPTDWPTIVNTLNRRTP